MSLCEQIGTLLSKASHSDELVAQINHTNLIFNSLIERLPYDRWKEGLQTLIQGVGDYLMRVVGSVPIGFHLTVVIDGEQQLYYYDTDIVLF